MHTALQSPIEPHADAASTSVHPEHLSGNSHSDTADQRLRFKPYQDVRKWLLDILPDLPIEYKVKTRIKACGRSAWVEYSRSRHKVRIASETCGSRLCPACRAKRAYLLSRRMMELTAQTNGYALKLITLTLKHSKRPLLDQIVALKAAFKRLRQTTTWKASFATGVGIIEVTRNEETACWHPHIHIVARCGFIPHEALKTAWFRSSHTSNIVDIRCIRGASDVARYVSAYVCKPPDKLVMKSTELAVQWCEALTRTHWIIPFGKRGTLPKLPPDTGPDDWERIGPLYQLASQDVPYRNADWALGTILATLDSHVIALIEGTDDNELAFDG